MEQRGRELDVLRQLVQKKKLVRWVGDPLDQIQVAMYADAGFSGCVDSLRSTSGCQVNLHGKNTRFPVGGKQQETILRESLYPMQKPEMLAADTTVHDHGLPCACVLGMSYCTMIISP